MVPIQAPKCGDFMGVKGNIQGTGGLGRLARRLRPLAPPVPLRPLERPILGPVISVKPVIFWPRNFGMPIMLKGKMLPNT